jgi:hypothetical protein
MSDSFKKYLEDYDRKAKGAGSDKGKDRLSALDVGEMFRGRGELSAQEGAQGVLDYFDANKGNTSHGGGTAKAIEKMQRIAGRDSSSAPDPTKNPDIQLSDRAASAIGGTKAYEDAMSSGLLSDMRFGGSDGSSQEDAADKFRSSYTDNVKKALSNNAGIEAGQTSDTGTTGGGEYTFEAAGDESSDVAKKIVGLKAGLKDLII